MGRSQTGEWCPPTHEISGSQLVHLLDRSRKRDSAPRLDWAHDEPTRKSATGAMESLARRDSSPVVVTPKPVVLATPRASRRPQPPSFAPSETEIERAMAQLESSYQDDEPTPLPPPPAVSTPTLEPAVPVVEEPPPIVETQHEVIVQPVAEAPKARGRSMTGILFVVAVLVGIAAGCLYVAST